ncbi:DUF6527 family protein [Phenylobacterium sp. Root700]|uniref:DUF6527 family protein n=1 Tax=Phenylobacterium sp. Root700 TaxID=1736591 RepID=UPI0006F55E98|nr:DUF6527 family protein [Phenylobacterium sp. Root700]KRB42047.1 hypothetical protein ASE02_04345 [Phenylobacterium sp. Root700]
MTRVERLEARIVSAAPDQLEDGVLYVSPEDRVALHACCCGCGEEVVTPLGDTEYSIDLSEKGVSIWPSIGNHDYQCGSHYIIEGGRVIWAGAMSRRAIEAGRARDRWLKRSRPRTLVDVILSWIRGSARFIGRISGR